MLWCAVLLCSNQRCEISLTDAARVCWYFEHTGPVDVLLGDATGSIVHWADVRSVWSGRMNCGVACSWNQPVSSALRETAVLLLKLFRQLTSGTSICELVCRLKKVILNQFCDFCVHMLLLTRWELLLDGTKNHNTVCTGVTEKWLSRNTQLQDSCRRFGEATMYARSPTLVLQVCNVVL